MAKNEQVFINKKSMGGLPQVGTRLEWTAHFLIDSPHVLLHRMTEDKRDGVWQGGDLINYVEDFLDKHLRPATAREAEKEQRIIPEEGQ